MKKSFFAFVFAGIGLTASASNTLFDVDYNEIANDLTEVLALEQFVIANEWVTYKDLAGDEGNLIENISDNTHFKTAMHYGPLGIPSYVWGCIFGIFGVLLVYFIEDDSDETDKAFIGCYTSALIVGVYSFILLIN